MTEWILLGASILFVGLRAAALVRFWRMPFSFGADRFFGLPVPAADVQPVLRRYRVMLFVIYVPDLLCALAAYYWAGLLGIALEQLGAAILTRVYHTLLAIRAIRDSKFISAGKTWTPVRSIAAIAQNAEAARLHEPGV